MNKRFTLLLVFSLVAITLAQGQSYTALFGWGTNNFGQVGSTIPLKQLPTQSGTDNNWSSIAAGFNYGIALKSDGSLWAWGSNSEGQLGDGTNISRISPVQVGTSKDWASVSVGTVHTLAIKTDGSLWAWGINHEGTQS